MPRSRFISLSVMIVFYAIAGINHFVNKSFYLPLIPDYLPWHEGINMLSGAAEMILAFFLIFNESRKRAARGLVILLILFIPSHIYFIQIGSCIRDGLCVPMWLAVLRLILIHPLLIWWAFSFSKSKTNS